MKQSNLSIVLVVGILLSGCINGPDPFDPLSEFHIQNMSEDSVICIYHCRALSISQPNEIRLANGEQKIMYGFNKNDTLSAAGLPHYNFKDLLFVSTNGDTLLYLSSIVDSLWIQYDTTFYNGVYGGHRWIYKFYKP